MAKVLIVDDVATNRLILGELLARSGHSVVETETINETRSQLERELPDLVLLDIELPDGSGVDFLKEVRKIHSPVKLPVIMVTGKSDPSEIVTALKAGANDYITKPINLEVTHVRVNVQLDMIKLNETMQKVRDLEAMNTMVVTLHHEINNPLAVALMNLALQERLDGAGNLNKQMINIKNSLEKIRDVVKAVGKVVESKEITLADYTSDAKMLKIK